MTAVEDPAVREESLPVREGPARLWTVCVAALTLLVLGFAGLGVFSWQRLHQADEAAQREQTVLTAARSELELMANLRHATARDSLDRAGGQWLVSHLAQV
ncbi:hypothetical protein LWP59_24050 [Amycolatopsis acidiphila]|uniref:Uncharacterized protein n=1 Tax=Amycolatopsis acidiphila TaxID=715473 RepID=A0A558AA55_9PSEU|nr:hypothetical protein [Amycolatopsis acidiphila]TVT21136.1 hypothetical protein FNH06_18085 [Amycolatopsis acidiphila]UIJ57224.1 hypothetical protein LWP59_24050 [Amycolatopsis acidiphila]GHG52569.1 hypothetical protein GCM10017788_00700 [Amycolatopsis acidiphila]